jgi:hypothetical protein
MAGNASSSAGCDVIGDIHGHATRLEALLAAMNYVERNGAWTHPERTASFVGDYVDRGPENLRTCRIVMAMVEAGSACAVMGNHDFNAICLATPDRDNPGSFLRPHTTKNLHQVAATQYEMDEAPEEAALVRAWLRQLPLWIDTGQLRVVHAAWSDPAKAVLAPFLDGRGALTEAGLVRAVRQGDPIRRAREYLLNGPETALPPGIFYFDPDGHRRTDTRIAWWKAGTTGLTWREVVLAADEVRAQMPATSLPSDVFDPLDCSRPTFFGHYWMRAPLALQGPMLACVDASVAKGGQLAAYRYSGESRLEVDHFLYV